MNFYIHIASIAEGLERLQHDRWGRQLWTEVKVRKGHICRIIGLKIPKGSFAYRPITNKGNRYERISEAGMNELKTYLRRASRNSRSTR